MFKSRSLKALLCTHRAFLYTTHELESIKWPWAGLFEMNENIEQGSNFIIDNLSYSLDLFIL